MAALTQQAFVIFGERDGRVAPYSLDGYGPVYATVATIPKPPTRRCGGAGAHRRADLTGAGAREGPAPAAHVPHEAYNLDQQQARESVRRLAALRPGSSASATSAR